MRDEPVDGLLETLPGQRARREDRPVAVADLRELQTLHDSVHRHAVREVLLVREDEDAAARGRLVPEDAEQLAPRLADARGVARIDNEQYRIRSVEERRPSLAERRLPREVPALQAHVLPLDRLNVRSDGRLRVDDDALQKAVQRSRFARIVESDERYFEAALRIAEREAPQLREHTAHFVSGHARLPTVERVCGAVGGGCGAIGGGDSRAEAQRYLFAFIGIPFELECGKIWNAPRKGTASEWKGIIGE